MYCINLLVVMLILLDWAWCAYKLYLSNIQWQIHNLFFGDIFDFKRKDLVKKKIRTKQLILKKCNFVFFAVISTYREPIKAWIDNIYGPTGLLIGTGMGIVRVILVNDKYKADIVPVDYVINGMIAASYKTARTEKYVFVLWYECWTVTTVRCCFRSAPIKIYNCVTSHENPITWTDYITFSSQYGLDKPMTSAIWYCSYVLVNNRFLYLFLSLLLHFLPALFIDAAAIILGKKPQ